MYRVWQIINIVTCSLKARFMQPEETAIPRQCLCKHLPGNQIMRHINGYIGNSRETVGGSVFCAVLDINLVELGIRNDCADEDE
jgi:hypothetical protein